MPAPIAPDLLSLYPALGALPALLPRLAVMQVPAGTQLFRENEACQGFPMVLSGEVRVSRSAANGRELELYRVSPGEMCLVSSAGLFADQPLTARGVTTCETRLTLLSPADFRAALSDERFRAYVLGLFAARMADLTGLIEAIAFQRLDSRLASALLGHGQQVRATHQALADELGTVREIVTRLLHRFERDGLVELSRECITIRDSAGLRAVAAFQSR
ncbi:MAG: transcriptional regulator [Burkholderiales bacterium RIFCSPHIGHO2_12_FULL_67_38]|nr:MAG: transcriptional regulator [Burkholderiales bacterium RIFCSPLOWO2_02_FULL_67_64]OGB54454.1 MAG: transcriptional regulator [Burkholderiales bacterium RIFCSPHIGHO2_12_FULL_67_38]OGB75498.1 MAG: transcriptional regulator [Burkholderiales bacterium RIFCSPLOWO2_12_FULL_67_210]